MSILSPSTPRLMTSRVELRRQMRRRRRALSLAERLARAECLAQGLAATHLFRSSRRIACYLSQDGELDLTPLMRRAWAMQKTCYLPVVRAFHPPRLWFAPYCEGDPLVCNRFGIPEPHLPLREPARAAVLDLILVPLVAFDEYGNRLGMGAGFYDRTFAFLKQRHFWQRPRLLGIGYDFQKVEDLQAQPWDVPLQGIATDARIYRVMSRSEPRA